MLRITVTELLHILKLEGKLISLLLKTILSQICFCVTLA